MKQKERFPIFRERLRSLQGDMSNLEFADFLGISRQTVGFYLNGDRIPDILVLRKIAERCNVSSDYLLGLSDYENYRNRGITLEQIGISNDAAEVQHEFWNFYFERNCPKSAEKFLEEVERGRIATYYARIRDYFLSSRKNYFELLKCIANYVRIYVAVKDEKENSLFPHTPIGYEGFSNRRFCINSQKEHEEFLQKNSPVSKTYSSFVLQNAFMQCVDDIAEKISKDVLTK